MSSEEVDQDEDDSALFQRAMRDVVPLKRSQRMPPSRRKSRGRARFTRAQRQTVLHEGPAPGADLYEVQPEDEFAFRRNGVSQTVFRDLRRGRYRVEAEIDLHGMTATEAAAQLEDFLQAARANAMRCVRIIHGKGLRSGNRGPVLKNTVNALLRRSDPVLAFASARTIAGGTGATLVLISRL